MTASASQQRRTDDAPALLIKPADPDVRPVRVTGTTASLILALLSHQDEIERYARGSVEIHWGPGSVQGRLHGLWEQTIAHAWTATRSAARAAASVTRIDVREGRGQRLTMRGTETPPWESPETRTPE